MEDIQAYISSGVLEQYVMGELTAVEAEEVVRIAAIYPQVQAELDAIMQALEGYAMAHSKAPPEALKTQLLATIEAGASKKKLADQASTASTPEGLPDLNEAADLPYWRSLTAAVQPPDNFGEHFTHVLGQDAQKITLMVLTKRKVEEEIHDDMVEKFLVLKGSCRCVVGEYVNDMNEGDYMAIPLHVPHSVTITSKEHSLFILQRKQVA